jgi:KaiC/GvpD/RAD55 family RecA-like ATPase
MRAIGISEFLGRSFDTYPFAGEWLESFGEPEKNMRVIIWGDPGNGKTEFCIRLAKQLAQFTRVYYNSFEQGICKTLQDALQRNNMMEVNGRVMFGNMETFTEMQERLSTRNAPQVCIIDSRDYMNLTTAQFKTLIEAHPRKCFVVVCWEAGGKPRGEFAKQIAYMCDVKIHVRNFTAHMRSRFGGNKNFVIWDRKPKGGEQLKLNYGKE